MKSFVAWSSLCLLCLGSLLPPSVHARSHRGDHSTSQTSVVSHKGKVTSFGYHVELDLLSATAPVACKIQIDSAPGTTFVVNLALSDVFRPSTEGMCRLAHDAFNTRQEISIEEDRSSVVGISISR